MIVGDQYPDSGRVNHALFNSGEAINAAKQIALEGDHAANPLGFWEGTETMSGVTNLKHPDKWAKVIFGALQRSTPACLDKVLVTMRNPAEQAASRSSTLDRWYADTRSAINWLISAELDYLIVDYGEMIKDPDSQLSRVSEFTGLNIDKHRVRQDLYRNKAPYANHQATELYLDILAGTYDPEKYPPRKVTPFPRPPRRDLDLSPEAKKRRSENMLVCKGCDVRSANMCSATGRRIRLAVDMECPEGKF
jgi:hypothetical protein